MDETNEARVDRLTQLSKILQFDDATRSNDDETRAAKDDRDFYESKDKLHLDASDLDAKNSFQESYVYKSVSLLFLFFFYLEYLWFRYYY